MKVQSILETIGRTPVVRLSKIAPPHVKLYAKLESFNPMGSVKDRMALAMIEDAERSGALKPGQTVIEATSGNTGIGLAMVCARKGYPLVVVMAENFSVERRRLMRFLGAKVVLTPAAQKGSGMYAKAEELAMAHGWFLARQFDNEANANAHSATTAQEILADFADERLDYWVSVVGTGGTVKGVARVLKQDMPHTRIIVAEPDNAPMLGSGIPQPANESHPLFRPHPIQGTSPDFIPKLTEDARTMIDRVIGVNGGEAMRLARALATEEGVFVGISAGAALAAALEVAKTAPAGASILVMLADTGERYLSTPLFEDIGVEMTDDETAISRSTPSCRFDAPPPAALTPAPQPAPAAADAEAAAFIERVLAEEQVVMFALEWCEFCWSLRRMFKAAGISYRSVDLDSAVMQEGDWGGRLRAALRARTGMQTIPQVFVAGQFIGGCTETLDAWNGGVLQAQLQAAGAQFKTERVQDSYSYLPKWLQPRAA